MSDFIITLLLGGVGVMVLAVGGTFAWNFYLNNGGAAITSVVSLIGRLILSAFSIVLTFNFTYNYITKDMLSGYNLDGNLAIMLVSGFVALVFAFILDALSFGLEKWMVDAKGQNVSSNVLFIYVMVMAVNGVTLYKSANYTANNVLTATVSSGSVDIDKEVKAKSALVDKQIALVNKRLDIKADDYKAYLEAGYFTALNNIKRLERSALQCKSEKCSRTYSDKVSYWKDKESTYIARAKRKMQLANSSAMASTAATLAKLKKQKDEITAYKKAAMADLRSEALARAADKRDIGVNTSMFLIVLMAFFSIVHGFANNAAAGKYVESAEVEDEEDELDADKGREIKPIKVMSKTPNEIKEEFIIEAMKKYADDMKIAPGENGRVNLWSVNFPRDAIRERVIPIAAKAGVHLEVSNRLIDKLRNSAAAKEEVAEYILSLYEPMDVAS